MFLFFLIYIGFLSNEGIPLIFSSSSYFAPCINKVIRLKATERTVRVEAYIYRINNGMQRQLTINNNRIVHVYNKLNHSQNVCRHIESNL